MKNLNYLSIVFLSFFFLCCATSEQVSNKNEQEEVSQVQPTKQNNIEAQCPTFSDARNSDDLEEAYVIYRDFLKVGQYEESFDYWNQVYQNAPAADGRRWNVFTDGVRYYEHKLTKDPDSKEEYVEKILSLYDEMADCYPNSADYAMALKGFDLFYKYRGQSSDKEIYNIFKRTVNEETPYFIINPLSSLLVELYLEDQITKQEARATALSLWDELKEKEAEGNLDENWDAVMNYAPTRLQSLEGIEGFYTCAYYRDRYYPLLDAETNCDTMQLIYSKMRWGGCNQNSTELKELDKRINNNCEFVTASGGTKASKGYEALRNGNYDRAITHFKEAAENASSAEKAASYYLTISKIYFSYLKNFPQARNFALQASNRNPRSGEPYILIGKLYASSGPLCGPGRGWDSQVVTWPALDMWQEAKRVDPSVSSEANKLISQYTQYMPTTEDIHQRPDVQAGQSYYVDCWIQRSTTVRAAPY